MLKLDFDDLLCYDEAANEGFGDWVNCGYTEAPYPEEIRDPSAYFVTYETGDNTVVTVDTATVPMDMYYSRAYDFGDDWDMVEWEDPRNNNELTLVWDWLEHGPEISEEASVTANADGSKFYAVWNQELEIGYEVFTDMDIEFRRIFYNLTDVDAYPYAGVAYASHTVIAYGDDLHLVGVARDHDRVGQGIVAYRWESDVDGVLGDKQVLDIPASSLTPGFHTLTFSAQDGEGNWSSGAEVRVFVVVELHQMFFPQIQ
jgi:hypothetical protein